MNELLTARLNQIRSKKEKLKIIFLDLIIICFFFILALIIVYPYWKLNGIIAYGESAIYLKADYLDYFSTWETKYNLGLASPHQSNIFLYTFFWKIFELIPNVHPSITWLFLSVFLPSTFFYIFIKKIFKIKNPVLFLPASLLYTFNPFRLLGPINERLNLLFVFLPIFFYLYHQFLNNLSWKYIAYLAITSLLSSSLGANLPVFSIPYFLMLIYFLYNLLFNHNKFKLKKLFIKNCILLLTIVAVNLFWLIPLANHLINAYHANNEGTAIFQASSAGTFYDHLRIMGSWAWRAKHYIRLYYPFSEVLDQPLFLLTTYAIPLICLLHLAKKKIDKNQSLISFSLFLLVISFLLLAGNKGPLGIIFNFCYRLIPFFKMYREPFAKFTPLFIFSLSLNLIFSLQFLFKKIKNWLLKALILISVSGIILLNSYPLFTSEALPVLDWNAGALNYSVKIPDYWQEASNFFNQDPLDYRLTIFPKSTYGTIYSWEYGVSVAGNMTYYLVDKPQITSWVLSSADTSEITNPIYESMDNEKFQYYLNILNSPYILQENDLDWRYSNGTVEPPSTSNEYLSKLGLDQIKTFGYFDQELINKIPNEEPNPNLKAELGKQLINKPALILYKTKDYLAHFYTPKEILLSKKEISDLPEIVSSFKDIRSAVLFTKQNQDKNNSILKNKITLDAPNIEFKKISSTKYRLLIKNAKQPLLLVMSEAFNPKWGIYASKYNDLNSGEFTSDNINGTVQNNNLLKGSVFETFFQKNLITEENHLKANGFANSWFISPDQICKKTYCQINQDSSYNIYLLVYYSPQNLFIFALALSSLISFILVTFIIILKIKSLLNKIKQK